MSDQAQAPSTEDVLFGGTTPSNPEAAKEKAPRTVLGLSTKLSAPEASDADKAWDADAKELYPMQIGLRHVFTNRANDLADELAETKAERDVRHKEFIAMARAAGFTQHGLLERLYNAEIDADLADARGNEYDDSAAHQSGAKVRAQLRATYGDKEAETLIAAAQKFVEQHPKLHQALGRRGIGSRQDIVIPIIEHVRRTNFR